MDKNNTMIAPDTYLSVNRLNGGILKGHDSYCLLNPLERAKRRTYRAISSANNLECVVKLYTPGSWTGEDDEDMRDCFLRETTIQDILAGAESHPNICYATDIQNQGNYRFVVFPYVRGGDLWTASGVLGPLEPRQSMQVVAGICDGLDHLHSLGVVHRDIKPDNVLLHISDTSTASVRNALNSGTLVPIVSDFEFALHERTRVHDNANCAIGTPMYIAPEMWKGHAVDCRSDIYGAGIMFFEILTGAYPFARSGSSVSHFQQAHLNATLRDPCRLNRKITPSIGAVLEKAMAKDPDRRYQTARHLKEDYLNAAEMKTNS